MNDIEVVPPDAVTTPREFVEFALKKARSSDGYLVFKKIVGNRTIVLRISPNGYGGYMSTIQMRQGTSHYPEPGGELTNLTVEAGCELYAWLRTHEDCNTMQKALVSPTGQALALCALFRLLNAHRTYVAGMSKKEDEIKELA